MAFGAIIALVFAGTQILVAVALLAFSASQHTELNAAELEQYLESNGFFLSISTLANMVICVGLMLLFAGIRRGLSVKDYLGFHGVNAKTFARWLTVIVIFALAWNGITGLLGREIVPEFMLTAYKTAFIVPLLWIALIVAAPVTEELFFRGFLFEGLRYSRLGPVVAVALTALAWASVHLQYDLYQMTTILILGVMLGIAKLHSRSIYVPIAMHSLTNLLAMIETAVHIAADSKNI